MDVSPRWGFSSFEVIGYNDVAPPELKNGSSAAARTSAAIAQQCNRTHSQPASYRGDLFARSIERLNC